MIARDEVVHIGGIDASSLAAQFDTPLYVYDGSIIEAQYTSLRSAFEGNGIDVDIKYAMKANTNPSIVRLLTDLGAGLDCASEAEVTLAQSLVEPEDVLYTAPYHAPSELDRVRSTGVTINFDDARSVEDHDALPARYCLRIDPGVGRGKHGLVFGGESTKFGTTPARAIDAYTAARDRGVRSFGIHMMTGSGVLDSTYFVEITERLLDIVERISEATGITFEFIDIGGGFGIPYEPDESPLDIETVGTRVCDTVAHRIDAGSFGSPTLVVEPGRYLVGPAGVLLTEVTAVKEKNGTRFVGVDTGMHHLLRPMLLDANHEILPVDSPTRPADGVADVVGPICSTVDTLASDRALPAVEPGELLAIMDVGAYGYSLGSHFNSRPRPAEVLVNDGTSRLIRTRESPMDVFRGTEFSSI